MGQWPPTAPVERSVPRGNRAAPDAARESHGGGQRPAQSGTTRGGSLGKCVALDVPLDGDHVRESEPQDRWDRGQVAMEGREWQGGARGPMGSGGKLEGGGKGGISFAGWSGETN